MPRIRLGVNIDHVATVRNARGEVYPSPLRAALLSEKCGADSITIHLREDRRHINEKDLKEIKSKLKIPLNLEIAATKEMLNISENMPVTIDEYPKIYSNEITFEFDNREMKFFNDLLPEDAYKNIDLIDKLPVIYSDDMLMLVPYEINIE